jgi:uncharacterized protein (DUF4415 family)
MSKTLKARTGRVLQLPGDGEDAAITAAALSDPDNQPLTTAQLQTLKPYVPRGRPSGSGAKTQVTLRIDSEILDGFKAAGAGWQTRINDALKDWRRSHA